MDTKNTILLSYENIFVLLYHSEMKERSGLFTYNQTLLYNTVAEIDKNAASIIVFYLNQGIFDVVSIGDMSISFEIEKVKEEYKSKNLFIINEKKVVYRQINNN